MGEVGRGRGGGPKRVSFLEIYQDLLCGGRPYRILRGLAVAKLAKKRFFKSLGQFRPGLSQAGAKLTERFLKMGVGGVPAVRLTTSLKQHFARVGDSSCFFTRDSNISRRRSVLEQ